MTIFEKIAVIISDIIGCEIDEVLEESTPDDLCIDSLDSVEIIMNTEREFSISISDADAVNCKTVGEFSKLVESLNQKP